MQSKKLESAVDTSIWRGSDPNYPGVPQPDPNLVAKSTSRATVTYDTYVLQYAARQRGHVLLSSFGVALAIGAAMYLSGPLLVILIAVGVGAFLAGSIGFLIAAGAHDSYTRDLAVSVSETYHHRPEPQPQPATVRPFVASANGDGRTTNTGRLQFEPRVWQALFDLALRNQGVIDKENVCKKAGIGRRWYHTDPNSMDGYRAFQAELKQLGFIDGRNRLTPAALEWYEAQIALPLSVLPARPRNDRPTGDRPATDRANDASGWGE